MTILEIIIFTMISMIVEIFIVKFEIKSNPNIFYALYEDNIKEELKKKGYDIK